MLASNLAKHFMCLTYISAFEERMESRYYMEYGNVDVIEFQFLFD